MDGDRPGGGRPRISVAELDVLVLIDFCRSRHWLSLVAAQFEAHSTAGQRIEFALDDSAALPNGFWVFPENGRNIAFVVGDNRSDNSRLQSQVDRAQARVMSEGATGQ